VVGSSPQAARSQESAGASLSFIYRHRFPRNMTARQGTSCACRAYFRKMETDTGGAGVPTVLFCEAAKSDCKARSLGTQPVPVQFIPDSSYVVTVLVPQDRGAVRIAPKALGTPFQRE